MWDGGSIGSGDLNSFQVVAYVVATTTQPADPSDVASSLDEHDAFNFFGLDLSQVHSSSYSSYIGGGSPTGPSSVSTITSVAPTSVPPSRTTSIPSTTSVSGPVQTQVSVIDTHK